MLLGLLVSYLPAYLLTIPTAYTSFPCRFWGCRSSFYALLFSLRKVANVDRARVESTVSAWMKDVHAKEYNGLELKPLEDNNLAYQLVLSKNLVRGSKKPGVGKNFRAKVRCPPLH